MIPSLKLRWMFYMMWMVAPIRGAEPLLSADVMVRMRGEGPRPYVAVWIENDQGKRIRTLKIFGNKPKYIRHLREWSKAGTAVDGLTGATRPNGDYLLSWDGKMDDGKAVPAGNYVFRAESVREDGDHCKVKVSLELGVAGNVKSGEDGDIETLHVRTPAKDQKTP